MSNYAVKNKMSNYVKTDFVDTETWTECPFSLGQFATSNHLAEVDDWVAKHANNSYTWTPTAFWFKEKADAFKFSLRWGRTYG